jgi:hypothetical protein
MRHYSVRARGRGGRKRRDAPGRVVALGRGRSSRRDLGGERRDAPGRVVTPGRGRSSPRDLRGRERGSPDRRVCERRRRREGRAWPGEREMEEVRRIGRGRRGRHCARDRQGARCRRCTNGRHRGRGAQLTDPDDHAWLDLQVFEVCRAGPAYHGDALGLAPRSIDRRGAPPDRGRQHGPVSILAPIFPCVTDGGGARGESDGHHHTSLRSSAT